MYEYAFRLVTSPMEYPSVTARGTGLLDDITWMDMNRTYSFTMIPDGKEFWVGIEVVVPNHIPKEF